MSIQPHLNRRNVMRGMLGATVGSFGWGFLIEPNQLNINYFTIDLPFLPKSLDGLRIGQLTDFHFRPDKDDELVAKAVKKANELDLDLIMLTGDFVDSDLATFDPLSEHLAKLTSKHGIYAVLGNHDGWASPKAPRHILQSLKSHQIELFINSNSTIQINHSPLAIAGTNYVWLGAPNPKSALQGIANSTPTLALVHEPDYFDTMCQHRSNFMQFSGHTHGGQCQIPFTGYAPVSVEYGRKYNYGSFQQGDARLFVSRGVGTTGPRVRFACAPELAVITLKSTDNHTS